MKVIGENVSIPTFDRPELLLQGDVEEDSDHDTQDTQEDPVDELTST